MWTLALELEAWASSPNGQLVLAALAIVVLVGVVLVAPMPLWSGQPVGPHSASDQPSAGVGWPGAALALAFGVGLCLPFRPYASALRAAVSDYVNTRLVVVLSVCLALAALLVYPGYGSDLFVYAAYERLWVVYGENALLAAPASHPTDWAYPFVWIAEQPNPYGPLWAAATWPVVTLARESTALLVAGYKLLAVLGYVACCGVLWTWPELGAQRRQQALVMFAWSPLVLFETLGKAHNDVLLALSALLAVRMSSTPGGALATVAGGLIKLSGLAVLPSVAMALARQRRWLAAGGGLLLATLAFAAAYAPFWNGQQMLAPLLFQTGRVVWSPGALLIGLGLDATLVRFGLIAFWLAVVPLVLWRVQDVASSACLVLLASLLCLTTAFFAHYLVPVVALAAVSERSPLRRLVLMLSVGAMAAYAVEVLALAIGTRWVGSAGYQVLGSLLLLGPVAVDQAATSVRSRIERSGRAARRCHPTSPPIYG